MTRFSAVAIGALAAATIGAFFFIQHLKVTTPFYSGYPNPTPAWIDPVQGGTCQLKGQPVSFQRTRISFYLVNRSDHVNMYVVNSEGNDVAQVASDRYMPKLTRTNSKTVRRLFYWNGHIANGSVAPDGEYYFRVALINGARAIDVGGPIHVQTVAPHPVVTRVTPSVIPQAGMPATIDFRGNQGFRSRVLVYRTGLPGRPKLVDSFETKRHPHDATWDGTIAGVPAPAGTYLIGLATTDRSCTTGRFPIVLPAPPGSTPHAGLTIRYLAAQAPLDPVPAGKPAVVFVDSRTRPYHWTLAIYGARRALAAGSGPPPGQALTLRMPRDAPGLYVVSIRSGPHRTAVPVVVSAPRTRHPPRVLVVLPALTWQGENPVDDDGDGLPNTLADGLPIRLDRPLANGLPAGLVDEAGLVAYLDSQRLPYDLTTDVGMADGAGPSLDAYRTVVFAGTETWLPSSLAPALRAYVEHGGHVLSLGIGSLLRTATLQNGEALRPTAPAPADVLGARPGPVVNRSKVLVTVIHDGLRIFTTTPGAFPGLGSYQPFTSVGVPGGPASEAGATTGSPAIVGYRLGSGIVVDIGLVGFGSSLRHNLEAQELVSRLWQVLGR